MQADENIGIFSQNSKIFESYQDRIQDCIRRRNQKSKYENRAYFKCITCIKTPLTSIINYSDLLKQPNLSKEQQDEYIDTIHKKSQRLKVLIEDLFGG